MVSSIGEDLDRLFQVPLSEFVQERNRLAGALKKDGDADGSRQVRELAKPSASAWAVNQLYWRDRSVVEQLVAAGDRYRAAQKAALSGASSEMESAEAYRRRAIEDAIRRTRKILAETGQSASDPVMRRIETTIETAASYGSESPKPLNGRLMEDLESPGFAALSGLAPSPSDLAAREKERLRLERQHDEDRLAKTRADVARASERLRRASVAVSAAQAELDRATGEAKQAAAELHRLEAEVAALEERGKIGEAAE
jgi:hypothetical protein